MTPAAGQHTRTGVEAGSVLARDLAHLQRLIGVMHHHAPQEPPDERELALLTGAVSASTAEQHLRAIGALLATLDTYLGGRRQPDGRRRHATAGCADADADAAVASTTAASDSSAPPVPSTPDLPDVALAAAAARYIARDLAARRLSEFTSAEGYRLARTLAVLGGAEDAVEQLLAEANTIRLHPPPLTDAVSHSPR